MPYLLLQSLTHFLVLALRNVHISSHPLNKQQEQTTLLEGENSDFNFWMERAWSPFHCHGKVTVEISWNFVLSATTVQSFSSIKKVFRDIPFFCGFTSFCAHNVMLQVILNNSATKSAITIKYMPFLIVLKALSIELIKKFMSYTLLHSHCRLCSLIMLLKMQTDQSKGKVQYGSYPKMLSVRSWQSFKI